MPRSFCDDNDNGQFLRPASVTRTVMPGVIVIPHGASARIDPETGSMRCKDCLASRLCI